MHCHAKDAIPETATDASKGGYHFLRWKWCVLAEMRPRMVRTITKSEIKVSCEKRRPLKRVLKSFPAMVCCVVGGGLPCCSCKKKETKWCLINRLFKAD
ncbi:hypothetical protein AtNW77_Chr3g0159161 [Arabidopsis thaliana]|uniref:Uncharacterized protein n=2 Tax=Arabidopsis thaliana TaxID=3702 RepID=A0A1I9LLJ8_ARATH|nr:uncharacterized protein AT3G04443 [Arabidopsis thaliana]NP_001325540.1 uncharacterized protein AT3G04443 [Arabidopsis thaliana]NP_001325541.1 uncharacterized protein AT3G04443 [Arabidopsis thaliana]NP_001325542.1 uncharacterized protein AT3G04443 [Arabidopsis thaliana]NP_001325543.1 uncharacterized protein AT3G04443 [Arabidopsis thaliana]ANM63453.1 hypothetical protein AT3G04443 [Arabidopsis thaliana]ANM63454.1 hypothetical protein AT3G04443 [Arabidopsis thaliana]ANM63455.1 hypothetical p|eukprot:NP_001325539.1 hypothetical protein AT3G04443 [Arabidopsis thaliana]